MQSNFALALQGSERSAERNTIDADTLSVGNSVINSAYSSNKQALSSPRQITQPGAPVIKKRPGAAAQQEPLRASEVRKPATVARGANPRNILDNKRTEAVTAPGTQQYNKDLSACAMSDVLVIDGIRPDMP